MQEGAGYRVVEKGVVDRVARQHDGKRQITAGNAFRQAHQVGPDFRLLVGEEGAGAAAADGDFVTDQVHFVLVAQLAGEAQVFRVVHRHAGGTLDQRFDDQRGRAFAVFLQPVGEAGRGAAGDVSRRFPRFGQTEVRRGQDVCGVANQRRVGVLENRDVGDGQRADGFAVVAAGEAEEFGFFRPADIAPVMKAHLQRDLGRRGAVRGVEGVAERSPVNADKRSESSTTGWCVKPASMTCSSVSSCSRSAALMRGLAWPKRLVHHELMPSR